MIEREITTCLKDLFEQYPFVTVTGPRQAGKTTLCRASSPHFEYVNLEAPDQREFAETDPHGFLSRLGEGAVLDEIQRVPELLSYLQVLADEAGRNGLFVLTGSEQFRFSGAIGQSLAGRTALLRLLPFSLAESRRAGASEKIDDILYPGFYPRIHDQGLEPRQALGDYFETYVERDVRRISKPSELPPVRPPVRQPRGTVGQSLGSGLGRRRIPHHGPSLADDPGGELHLYDVGLASYLIGIEHAAQLSTHPPPGSGVRERRRRGGPQTQLHRGRRSNLSFYRDVQGLKCDLLY